MRLKILLITIVRIDNSALSYTNLSVWAGFFWYYHTKFQLIRRNTVGCESIWKFQEARPKCTPCGKLENPTPSGCADYRPAKFQLNRIRSVAWESIGISQKARPHSTSWKKIEKSGSARLWGLMFSIILQRHLNRIYIVSCESAVKIRRWKISIGAPTAPPVRSSKNSAHSDCADRCLILYGVSHSIDVSFYRGSVQSDTNCTMWIDL